VNQEEVNDSEENPLKRPLKSGLRLGAVLAVGSLLAIGSGSVDAGQAAPAITAGMTLSTSSTLPGTVVGATGTFQSTGELAIWEIGVDITGLDSGDGTLTNFVGGTNTSGCVHHAFLEEVTCLWTPTVVGEQTTITVDVVVAADAPPASPGWLVSSLGALSGGIIIEIASANLEILAAPPVTDPPPTNPPVVDPPAVDPPASGGTPTAAPTQLPATGTSMWPFVLVGFLALAAGAGALRLSRSD
jgi:LPXTG-motif cell wall-anchored protein